MLRESLLLFVASILVVKGFCPTGGYYDSATSKCFMFSEGRTNWFTAKETCRLKGAFLAKVESQAEMDFMRSVKPKNYYWMGINDLETENTFKWLDGTPVEWFGWKSNQPNGGVTQNCTTIDSNWQWQDKECENLYYFVCNPLNVQALYGSQKLDHLHDASSLTSTNVLNRVDCASICKDHIQCAFWGFTSSSTSKNCKLYRLDLGGSESTSSSWDYYRMEWIETVNNTQSY